MERFTSPAARALDRLGPRHHSLESVQCVLAAQTLHRFGTSGCTLPAASVARARSVCRPASVACHANDQSCHWYGPLGGSSCAACQSPSPVKLTWTCVTGPVPDQAFPRTV